MKLEIDIPEDLADFVAERASERDFGSIQEFLLALIEEERSQACQEATRKKLGDQLLRDAGPNADMNEIARRVDEKIATRLREEVSAALTQLDEGKGVEFDDADVEQILTEGRQLLAQRDAKRRTA